MDGSRPPGRVNTRGLIRFCSDPMGGELTEKRGEEEPEPESLLSAEFSQS